MNQQAINLVSHSAVTVARAQQPRPATNPYTQQADQAEQVTTVNVRLRQNDAGVLYEKKMQLSTDTLNTYQAGEMLDFYV